jgi:hypothetical protein
MAFAAACPVDRISVAKISEVETHIKQVAPIIKSRAEKEQVNNNAHGISIEANKTQESQRALPVLIVEPSFCRNGVMRIFPTKNLRLLSTTTTTNI